MMIPPSHRKSAIISTTMALLMSLMMVGSCRTPPHILTVGIVVWDTESGNTILDGFKNAMSQLGYIEGNNIKYISNTVPEKQISNIPFVDTQIEQVIGQKVDLLLVIGREVIARAKELVAGTDIPVIFAGASHPVEEGLIESIAHPGGNLTGIKFANSIPKAFEWLVSISGSKKVYVPYDPGDDISIFSLTFLNESAFQLGVELVLGKVHSVEEAAAGIENLPGDVDAVFRIPSSLLDPKNSILSLAAINKRIPMVAPLTLDEAVLASFKNDEYSVGGKMARLVQQVVQGAKPADLPVETGEVTLTINLKTAEAIGLSIPDEVLAQAHYIIR